eukprot:30135-Pelagococcus_subviridis.AAC.15
MRLLARDGAPPRVQRVAQQHRDRHRPDAARDRRDLPRDLAALLEVHVPGEPVPRLLRRVRHGVSPDVDDRRAAFDPVLFDHVRRPRGGDDDVRLAHDPLRVLRPRVHHGHGAVFLHEHQRRGHPDDVGPTDDDGVLPSQLHAASLEQHDAALRRARHEQRLVALHRELPDVQRVEPVHVLLQGDRREDLLLVHVLRKRELDEDAVAVRVGVEALDDLKHLRLGRGLRDLLVERPDPSLVARLALHPHVRRAVRSRADDDDREPRDAAVRRLELGHLLLDLGADVRRDRFAVDHRGFAASAAHDVTLRYVTFGVCRDARGDGRDATRRTRGRK